MLSIDEKQPAIPITFSAPILGSRALTSQNVELAFAVKTVQSGVLVAGHSKNYEEAVIFNVKKLKNDGTEIGGYDTNSGETVILPHPSVNNWNNSISFPDGTTLKGTYGSFLVNFGETTSTQLNLYRSDSDTDISANLPEINEVIIRMDSNSLVDESGNSVQAGFISSPHFIVKNNGVETSYQQIKINNETWSFKNLEHLFLIPASIVGDNFCYLVESAENIVANPVSGDYVSDGSSQHTNIDKWIPKDDWLTNNIGNAGLFQMIDNIAEVSTKEERVSSQKWQEVAEYFRFFL